jgi:phosphopantothenoylcysteine decarboxylase/phosphopantothenate--cysteine ligase
VAELSAELQKRFDPCDALVMAAAVGDYEVRNVRQTKLRRSDGPLTVELAPTEDILAGLGSRRRADQIIVAFAVADVDVEAAARRKLLAKNADYIVVNSPAAIGANVSRAAILSRDGVVLDWADRPKTELARAITALLR